MCVVTSKKAPLKMDPSLTITGDVTSTNFCGKQIVVNSYMSGVYFGVCV